MTSGSFPSWSLQTLKKGQPKSLGDHLSEGAQRRESGMAFTRSLPTSPSPELEHQVSIAC